MPRQYPQKYNTRLLHEKVLNSCFQNAQKTAMAVSGQISGSYTYDELYRLIPRLAGYLNKSGMKKGDRAAVLSENRPEWGIVYLSILCAGGVVIPIDPSLKPREFQNLIGLADAKMLFVSQKYESITATLHNRSENNLDCIVIGGPRYDEMTVSEKYISDNIQPHDPAILIYTSGTTGDPKGVILTHRNITANLESIAAALTFYPEDIVLSLLPLHHTFEATCGFLTPITLGHTIIYARSLKSRDIFEDIKNHRVTYMIGVPLLYEKMYHTMRRRIAESSALKRLYVKTGHKLSRLGWRFGIKAGRAIFGSLRIKAGLSSIRMFVSGGAPLPAVVSEWLNLIGFDFMEGYGLTECAPVVSVNRNEDIRFASVGPPLPNVEVAIDNPTEDGIGEIKIRGENITPGYLNNKKATDELLRDGWLYSGDLGILQGGHLYIKGRAKNIIVTPGGKNIHPEEIEDIMCQSPFILEALVLARRGDIHAEAKICAIIVPDMEEFKSRGIARSCEDDRETLNSIIKEEIANLNKELANYKRVADFELRFEEFEKTSTKKIKRTLYK